MRRRILYLQYTDPAAYPPIEHSARIFARSGWQVTVLGTGTMGGACIDFSAVPNITITRLGFVQPGWMQKLHFLKFCVVAMVKAIIWRPDWIYASDPLSCPSAWAAARISGAGLVYHEHDSPAEGDETGSIFLRIQHFFRKAVARRAAMVVLPSEGRKEIYADSVGRRSRVHVVWNCPGSDELVATSATRAAPSLRVLYHGSIVPERLPITVLHALQQLPAEVTLTLVGYETVGARGYVATLLALARNLGIEDRVNYHGTVRTRRELLQIASGCDVGLALMPIVLADANMRTMAGASNKPFDYLACGLAVLVSDRPEWRALFVDNAFGRACNPSSADSIASALRWCLDNRELMVEMGERGRMRIREEWNYEAQFAPVFQAMVGKNAS